MEPMVQSTFGGVKVVVMGEDPLVRRGLRSVLEETSSVAIVEEADCPSSAMEAISRHGPEVLLMTLSQGSDSSLGFISQLRKVFSRLRVILTGMSIDKRVLLAAVEHGAFGYVPSHASAAEFEAAFNQVLNGQCQVMTEIAGDLLFHALMQLNGEYRDPDQSLSAREYEVLQRMARGMSNKEIGADLHISLGTVKAHVSNILRKLGAADRTQAVVRAIREGIVDLE